MQWSGYTDTQLDRFARYQRRSFEIQRQVAARPGDGTSERQATTWMLEVP